MSKIRVNTEQLEQQRQQLEKVVQELQTVSEEVSYVNHNLSWQVSSRDQIKVKLNDYSAYIGTMQRRTNNLSSVLQSVSQQYQNTEKKLGAVVPKDNPSQDNEAVENKEKTKDKKPLWTWSDTWKEVDQIGIIGTIVGLIGNLITGGVSVKNGLKTVKNLNTLIGKIAKASSGASFDWKHLLGLTRVIDKDSPTNFWKALDEEAGKLKFSDAKSVGDKISVGTKWAGYALTGIITAYDNFTDEENTTFGRKLAETIGETTIKIGEGIVLTAGVKALLATVGIGVASGGLAVLGTAVAVGAGFVTASWLLDKASQALTGKDFAEAVSDAILDKGKELIDKKIEKVKNIGATVKKAGDTIGGWWKNIGKTWAPA